MAAPALAASSDFRVWRQAMALFKNASTTQLRSIGIHGHGEKGGGLGADSGGVLASMRAAKADRPAIGSKEACVVLGKIRKNGGRLGANACRLVRFHILRRSLGPGQLLISDRVLYLVQSLDQCSSQLCLGLWRQTSERDSDQSKIGLLCVSQTRILQVRAQQPLDL